MENLKIALAAFLAKCSDEELEELGVQRLLCTEFKETKQENSNLKAYSKKEYYNIISDILKELGIPVHNNGYRYLIEAIYLSLTDLSFLNMLTKRLYPTIATQYNTTWVRVERGIRHAIAASASNANLQLYQEIFSYSIPFNKDKPTNGQFVSTLVDYIQHNY